MGKGGEQEPRTGKFGKNHSFLAVFGGFSPQRTTAYTDQPEISAHNARQFMGGWDVAGNAAGVAATGVTAYVF